MAVKKLICKYNYQQLCVICVYIVFTNLFHNKIIKILKHFHT